MFRTFDQIVMNTNSATACRSLADGLDQLARSLRYRADTLDHDRANGHASLSDYRTAIRAAQAVRELVSLGVDRSAAIEKAAISYKIEKRTICAHLATVEKREALEAIGARKRAAKAMAARSVPQRDIARNLGVSQPRVSQLIRD